MAVLRAELRSIAAPDAQLGDPFTVDMEDNRDPQGPRLGALHNWNAVAESLIGADNHLFHGCRLPNSTIGLR